MSVMSCVFIYRGGQKAGQMRPSASRGPHIAGSVCVCVRAYVHMCTHAHLLPRRWSSSLLLAWLLSFPVSPALGENKQREGRAVQAQQSQSKAKGAIWNAGVKLG